LCSLTIRRVPEPPQTDTFNHMQTREGGKRCVCKRKFPNITSDRGDPCDSRIQGAVVHECNWDNTRQKVRKDYLRANVNVPRRMRANDSSHRPSVGIEIMDINAGLPGPIMNLRICINETDGFGPRQA